MIDIINDLSKHLGMNRKNISNCIKPKAIRNQSTEITESWPLKNWIFQLNQNCLLCMYESFSDSCQFWQIGYFEDDCVLKLKYELEWFIFYLKVPPDHVDFKIWNTSWNDILEALSLLSTVVSLIFRGYQFLRIFWKP